MFFVTIVLDGVGFGAGPDAHLYGDSACNTLAHICSQIRPQLPNLAALGLGNIARLEGITPVDRPMSSYGRMQEVSAGKDSTTGHWELAGLRLEKPFPTYPDGFPEHLVARFLEVTGCSGILGNKPASGTEIISELGEAHELLRFPIVYTSADSVFQVAAHTSVLPLDELYRICRIARDEVCVGEHAVGRVIARPFQGVAGAYERISAARKDFSLRPTALTLQEALQAGGVRTVAVGKIADLFGGVGFDEVHKTRNNDEGQSITLERMEAWQPHDGPTFLWTNLVDFDQEYGHRNDPQGFARALEAFDRFLPHLLAATPEGGRLLLTADHGNDPTTPGTDHSRELVPILYVDGREARDLGIRASFNDHAATVADFFGVRLGGPGISFEAS